MLGRPKIMAHTGCSARPRRYCGHPCRKGTLSSIARTPSAVALRHHARTGGQRKVKWSPPFGDGDGCAHRCAPAGSGRFNGTTAFRRWRSHGPTGGYQRRRPASMGPPPFGDGNRQALPITSGRISLLQWGHRLSAMETAIAGLESAFLDEASMGPPPFGDGNSGNRECTGPAFAGFNGATAFRRWKP